MSSADADVRQVEASTRSFAAGNHHLSIHIGCVVTIPVAPGGRMASVCSKYGLQHDRLHFNSASRHQIAGLTLTWREVRNQVHSLSTPIQKSQSAAASKRNRRTTQRNPSAPPRKRRVSTPGDSGLSVAVVVASPPGQKELTPEPPLSSASHSIIMPTALAQPQTLRLITRKWLAPLITLWGLPSLADAPQLPSPPPSMWQTTADGLAPESWITHHRHQFRRQ